MLLPLDWLASTPEGARLGKLAVDSVQLELRPVPWYGFFWEPVHWFYVLVAEFPHSFYAIAFFAAIALALGLLAARRAGWVGGMCASMTILMLLVGGLQADSYVRTQIPFGTHWIVPVGAPFRLANLHAHTQASGAMLMPEDVVRWHKEKGYSVVAITDSNKIYGGLRARELAGNLGVVVVPGEEYRGSGTHLIMLNLPEAIRADRVPLAQAVARARSLGAFVIAAHPWTSTTSPERLEQMGVQAFEVVSGRVHSGWAAEQCCHQHHLAELGSLDFREGQSCRCATVLPASANSPEAVQRALERGESAALSSSAGEEQSEFHWWVRLRHELHDNWVSGGRLLLPGLLLWGMLAWGFKNLPPSSLRPAFCLLVVTLFCGLTGILGIWSVWWKFKQAWFPRVELPLAIWAVACPVCLWISGSLVRQGEPTAHGGEA
jgi:hypothetical protein